MTRSARWWVRGLLLAAALIVSAVGGVGLFRRYEARRHLDAATAALAQFQYDLAFIEFDQCAQHYRADGNVRILGAQISRRAGRLDEARAHLDAAVELLGDRADAVRLEQQLLSAQDGSLSEFSMRALRERADADPKHRILIFEALAQGWLRTNRWGPALDVLEAWLTAPTNDPRPYYWRGILYDLKNPKGPDAFRAFAEALLRDPDHLDARLALAELHLKASDPDAAEPHFQHLVITTGNTQAAIGLARCRAGKGDLGSARELLSDVLRREPESPAALRELGVIQMSLGELASARIHLERACRLWPHDLSANHNLYLAYQQSGMTAEADAQLAKHKTLEARLLRIHNLLYSELQKRPDDLDVLHELGKLHLEIGGLEYETQALAWLQRVLQLQARHRATYALLAGYYERKGNADMAARCRRLAQ